MKELPDEKIMLEMLEKIKEFEQAAREIFDLSSAIALKYQRLVREIQAEQQQQSLSVDQSGLFHSSHEPPRN